MNDAEYTAWRNNAAIQQQRDQARVGEDQTARLGATQHRYDTENAQGGYAHESEMQASGLAGAMAQLKAQQEAEAARQAAQFGFQSEFQTNDFTGREHLAEGGYAHDTDMLNRRGELGAEAEARRMEMIRGLMDSLDISGGGGGNANPDNAVMGEDPTEDAARSAAFARAKDQAGLIGRSAMQGLQEATAGRGMNSRSGLAVGQAGGVINQGANQLGEVNRSQAMDTATNARQRASERLSAYTAQRGQNIGLLGSALSGLGSVQY
jgi:hypothetical protein